MCSFRSEGTVTYLAQAWDRAQGGVLLVNTGRMDRSINVSEESATGSPESASTSATIPQHAPLVAYMGWPPRLRRAAEITRVPGWWTYRRPRSAALVLRHEGIRQHVGRPTLPMREKRAPETKPSPLRQGAGSRRSRSVGRERAARAAEMTEATAGVVEADARLRGNAHARAALADGRRVLARVPRLS
jgi:hypothetical protein